jgi:hypothetical protein
VDQSLKLNIEFPDTYEDNTPEYYEEFVKNLIRDLRKNQKCCGRRRRRYTNFKKIPRRLNFRTLDLIICLLINGS